MAIIFVSPKKRQRMFFAAISVVVVLAMMGISAIVFWPELQEKLQMAAFPIPEATPGVILNFSVVDSEAVKNLALFQSIPATAPIEGRQEPFSPYGQP